MVWVDLHFPTKVNNVQLLTMAFDSQTISLALAIVAIGMTLYLYRKTNIELQDLKSSPAPLVCDAKPPQEKSQEVLVKDEA